MLVLVTIQDISTIFGTKYTDHLRDRTGELRLKRLTSHYKIKDL